ncbi:MAG TPA: glutamine--fructose-6-phosphate transaminase (isomerizing) [Acidimicrobiales bacterium]|nr:glutamine--fructose-6-phosphate transaminase (isomerizing) [Acidimicrobiales bacterium]
MCGIIGVTGSADAVAVIMEGLSRLEYRGYDSAGVALQDHGTVWTRRRAGKLAELIEVVGDAPADATAGIGHTRWATHGRPDDRNAHPHTDCSGRLAIVHNGIIENHAGLRAELEAAGHTFASDTDTEVLAHLIESHLGAGTDLAEAVRATLSVAQGAFAVAVIHADEPDLIVASRRVSPLIIGRADGLGLVGSDIPALLGQTRELYAVDDDQLVEIRPGSFRITTLDGTDVEPRPLHVEWDLEQAEKGGYDDFMLKEIYEQPRAVADTLLGRVTPGVGLSLDETRLDDGELREIDKVFIVGCGTSYYAGLAAKYAIEHWTRLPVEIDIASEFRYRDPVLDRNTLVVGVSQSGETVDTLQAMRHAKRWKAKVLVITNVVDSSMAREGDAVLYTRAGPEIGVAATKTHLAQLVAMQVLALYLAQLRGTLYPNEINDLIHQLHRLPQDISRVLECSDHAAAVADQCAGARDFFYLGRHVGYPVALEGALKLKEIAYLRAEGYPAGELKHGPIALIEEGTVVVGVANRGHLLDKMLSNVAEVRARGASVVLVATEGDEATAALADHVLTVPDSHELFAPVLTVIPLQLFAYHLAKARGNDVDKPRNLAKTVTVE